MLPEHHKTRLTAVPAFVVNFQIGFRLAKPEKGRQICDIWNNEIRLYRRQKLRDPESGILVCAKIVIDENGEEVFERAGRGEEVLLPPRGRVPNPKWCRFPEEEGEGIVRLDEHHVRRVVGGKRSDRIGRRARLRRGWGAPGVYHLLTKPHPGDRDPG